MLKNIGKPKEAENTQTVLSASAPSGDIQQQINAATALQNPQQNTLGAKPEDFIPRLAENPKRSPFTMTTQCNQHGISCCLCKGG